jgi:gamma-glutamyltranspeptidase/glutathione hydrolase
MVASADQLATQAGMRALARGGNAVDAAIATNAAIAVTAPNLCGLGGDLFALVHTGTTVHALNSSGRAGAGADAAAMRAEGLTEMPFRHDLRSVTVPGCVDGWVALHERFGSLPLAPVLQPAIELADGGFPASPLLVAACGFLDDRGREQLHELASQAKQAGDRVRRPGAARALRAIATAGRDGFYLGEFGEGLLELGRGQFSRSDLAAPGATWSTPLTTTAFGTTLHTIPPNSQGYLLLAAARLADQFPSSEDPHVLIEAAKAAGRDRPAVLSDAADGDALLVAIDRRRGEIDPEHAADITRAYADGDTTYLCTVDGARMGVSLIQSNASNFGSWIVEPNTRINLHNRGLGFSLAEGHPAELAPGRRPPHTLSPALATNDDGSLRCVFGTMGGDGQPQILLQVADLLFRRGENPGAAIGAGRWVLKGPVTGFDTWTSAAGPAVQIEGHAPAEWAETLAARGHRVEMRPPLDSGFGHAHAIVVGPDGMLAGAADPRTVIGSAAGL